MVRKSPRSPRPDPGLETQAAQGLDGQSTPTPGRTAVTEAPRLLHPPHGETMHPPHIGRPVRRQERITKGVQGHGRQDDTAMRQDRSYGAGGCMIGWRVSAGG